MTLTERAPCRTWTSYQRDGVLVVDVLRRGDLFVDYMASDDLNQSFDVSWAELLADTRGLAVEASIVVD